jgi:hypothetical protein
LIRCVFGLPEDFDDVPALSVVDGLDGVDAAGERLAGEGSGVGAPEMGDVAESFGLIFDLVFGDDFVAVFGNAGDPVIDGEGVRAVGGDGDEPCVGEENLAEAGAVGQACGVVGVWVGVWACRSAEVRKVKARRTNSRRMVGV